MPTISSRSLGVYAAEAVHLGEGISLPGRRKAVTAGSWNSTLSFHPVLALGAAGARGPPCEHRGGGGRGEGLAAGPLLGDRLGREGSARLEGEEGKVNADSLLPPVASRFSGGIKTPPPSKCLTSAQNREHLQGSIAVLSTRHTMLFNRGVCVWGGVHLSLRRRGGTSGSSPLKKALSCVCRRAHTTHALYAVSGVHRSLQPAPGPRAGALLYHTHILCFHFLSLQVLTKPGR